MCLNCTRFEKWKLVPNDLLHQQEIFKLGGGQLCHFVSHAGNTNDCNLEIQMFPKLEIQTIARGNTKVSQVKNTYDGLILIYFAVLNLKCGSCAAFSLKLGNWIQT